MNSFKLFGLKRKLDIFCPVEVFFELHSIATEGKKGKKWVKKSNFLANRKSLNEFYFKLMAVKKKAYSCCIDTVKPVRDALDVINGKWKLPIIISVGVGNDRFTDIQKSIPGITPKVLAKELKDLEQHRLIKRIVIDEYPVKIVYKKNAYADTLTPIIYSLKEWGLNHRKEVLGTRSTKN